MKADAFAFSTGASDALFCLRWRIQSQPSTIIPAIAAAAPIPIPAPAPAERPDEPSPGVDVWLGSVDTDVAEAEVAIDCGIELAVVEAANTEDREAADCDARA